MISTLFIVIIIIGAITVIYFANKEDKKDSIDSETNNFPKYVIPAPEKIEPPKKITQLIEKPRPITPAIHKVVSKPLIEGKVKTEVKQNHKTNTSKTVPPPAQKPNHKKNKYKKNK